MRKIIHFILLGLFIVQGILVNAQDPKTLSITVSDTAPEIDGVVDDLWNAITAVPAESLNLGTVDSDADFSVAFKTTFTNTHFFALVEITDDKLNNAHADSIERDLVELYFDMDNSKNVLNPPYAPWPSTAYDDNDVQISFIWDTDNSGELSGEAVSAQVNTSDGWLIEIMIPWELLMESFVPEDGIIIGFDLNSADNDGADREAKLSWNMWEDEAWHDPHYMGNLELLGYIPPEVITEFSDNFEGTIWEGWDTVEGGHTVSQADGILTIEVDKVAGGNNWAGLHMTFGDNTILDLSQNGWITVDLKANDDCLVDIGIMDINKKYNPGSNQLQLVGGADWTSMKFEYAGDNLDANSSGVIDPTIIDLLLLTFNGGSPWTGTVYMDNLKLGLADPDTAMVTFIVDDSQQASHTSLAIEGSWDTSTGRYDVSWSDSAEHSGFYDDGTHGDVTASDHIWTVVLKMIPDVGANNWEWGVNDASGNWIDGNFVFTVTDATAQTLDAFIITAVDLSRNTIYYVYPNPATSTLFIDNGAEISTIEMINMSGQVTMKLLNEGNSTINISVENQLSGIYIVRIINHTNEVDYLKLIIK